MTDHTIDDNDEKVGPGNPPKQHRFKRGEPSPNPRGRPRKAPRMLLPIERARDIIASLERPIKTSKGTTTFAQLNLEMMKKKASEGNGPAQRYLDRIRREALDSLEREFPDLARKNRKLAEALISGGPPNFVMDSLAVLAEESKLATQRPLCGRANCFHHYFATAGLARSILGAFRWRSRLVLP